MVADLRPPPLTDTLAVQLNIAEQVAWLDVVLDDKQRKRRAAG
jgi:hypothetical protein